MRSTDFAIRADKVSKRFRRGMWAHETLRSALANQVARLRGCEPGETTWFNALDEVCFTVRQGESVALVGDNGAGKSTLLKIMSRITPPTSGRITLRGRVGSLLEVGSGFHPDLTGRDNIFLNGMLLGMSRNDIAKCFDEIVDFSGVEAFLETPVKRYSSGMYMRLAFAVAAHLETEILLIDEVLAVGDIGFQQKCLDRMNGFSASGRTILFVSHNLTAMRSLCQRAILLEKGSLVDDGPTGQIINRYVRTNSGGSNGTAVLFKPGQLPEKGQFQVLAASARPKGGAVGDPIHVKSDIVLEFTVRQTGGSTGKDPLVQPTVSIRTAGGELLFCVSPPEQRVRWPSGQYRISCHVPGDLLNNGRHIVGFEIAEDADDPLRLPGLLELEIMDHQGDRFGWFGDWPGLIRPRLAWERIRLEVSDADCEGPSVV